ncbi:MAG: hypothetical protein HWE14_03630 [Flavobacteriia bacterium]|nr:hypothetical protein [Flavobacteriia bacterium]
MKEFRPHQAASRPIFLITFTVLGIIYIGWYGYAYFTFDEPINWNAAVFVLGVIAFLWYTRVTQSYYLRIDGNSVEWKLGRKDAVKVTSKEVTMVSEHTYSLDFLVAGNWIELSLEKFGKHGRRSEVVAAIKEWCAEHKIEFEQPQGS